MRRYRIDAHDVGRLITFNRDAHRCGSPKYRVRFVKAAGRKGMGALSRLTPPETVSDNLASGLEFRGGPPSADLVVAGVKTHTADIECGVKSGNDDIDSCRQSEEVALAR